jgi:hypothetical protein
MKHRVALFGEAEKGSFKVPHVLKELPQLMDRLGNPPHESQGLFFAVQALLYEREIIYFRVAEEGFSKLDYFTGIKYLGNWENVKQIHAICMPGVGDREILEASTSLCKMHQTFLITTEKDLYDYLTSEH